MAVTSGLQATLNSGQFTKLASTFFQKTRVVITGSSGEELTVTFRVSRWRISQTFEGTEAAITGGRPIGGRFPFPWFGTIGASTPQGVATVDIIYEVRTGADA